MEIYRLTRTRSRQWVVEAFTDPWNRWHSSVGLRTNIGDANHQRVLNAVWKHESDHLVPVLEGWRDLATDGFVPLRVLAAYLHSRCGDPVLPVRPTPAPTPLGTGTKNEALRTEHSHGAFAAATDQSRYRGSSEIGQDLRSCGARTMRVKPERTSCRGRLRTNRHG